MNNRSNELRRIVWVATVLVAFSTMTGTLFGQSDAFKPIKKRVTGDPYFTPSLHQNESNSTASTAASSENAIKPIARPEVRSTTLSYLESEQEAIHKQENATPDFANPDSTPKLQSQPGAVAGSTIEQKNSLSGAGNNDFAPPNSSNVETSSIIRQDTGTRFIASQTSPVPPQTGASPLGQSNSTANRKALPPLRNKVSDDSPQQIDGGESGKVKTVGFESFEPGQVLAVVGGEPIFVGDLIFEANTMLDKFIPDAPAAIKDQQRPELIKRLLPKFIDSKMLYVATIRGLPEGVDMEKVLEQAGEEFDAKALPILLEQYGVTSPAMVDANLRSMGHSLRKMRDSWSKDQLTKYFLGQQLNIETEVTHAEMIKYYREHFDDYDMPARARWEQVMVRFDRFPTRAAARQAVVELGNQIVYGAPLDAVAKRDSQGYDAAVGGQHDWTTKGSLVLTALDKAIFSLPVGELSEIIESRDGYHIVRVKERIDATRKPFLEAQIDIKTSLQNEKREAAFQEHISKLRREIPIEIYDDKLDASLKVNKDYTLKPASKK